MPVVCHIFSYGLWVMGEPSPSWIKSNHHGILVFEDARNDSLGHNSEAVHVAYANRALMKIPSLQDYEEHMAIKTNAISAIPPPSRSS